jgi:hypothetical protein
MSLSKPIVSLVAERMLDIWESAERWTTGTTAREEDGDSVEVTSSFAVRWCAVGCLERALYDLSLVSLYDEFEGFLNLYTQRTTDQRYNRVIEYNDSSRTSFEDMRLFVKGLLDVDPDEIIDDAPEEDNEPCEYDDGPGPF